MDRKSSEGIVQETGCDVEQITNGSITEMEQDPIDDEEPNDTGEMAQNVEEMASEEVLANDHTTSEKENDGLEKPSEAEQPTDNPTLSGYLGYDVDGNVVLAEGDFVVGIEEIVAHVPDDDIILNVAETESAALHSDPQEMEDDGSVLAYIAANDLDQLVGLTDTEVGDGTETNLDDINGHQGVVPDGMNGFGNHSDDLDEIDAEEGGVGREEYEDESFVAEEVGESLDTAVAEEPLAAEEVAEVSDERNLGLKFPLTRVKRIMKADPDMQLVSQDAVFLITKATELFVEVVADAAFHHTLQAGRKTLLGRDLDACIDLIDALAFLDGALDADQ